MQDKIILHDCKFEAIIGINDEERLKPRELFIDITLLVDIQEATKKDAIEATVSYTDVHKVIKKLIEGNVWNLIETVAERSASAILDAFTVMGVVVRVKKPSGLKDQQVAYTAVEITRLRPEAL